MEVVHGNVEFSVDGQVIFARLSGSFNEHGAKAYTHRVEQLVGKLNPTGFALLIDNLDLEGGTPEAYAELERYNKWLNEQNLIAKAIVVKQSLLTTLINSLSPSIKQQNCSYFSDIKQASDWINAQLS